MTEHFPRCRMTLPLWLVSPKTGASAERRFIVGCLIPPSAKVSGGPKAVCPGRSTEGRRLAAERDQVAGWTRWQPRKVLPQRRHRLGVCEAKVAAERKRERARSARVRTRTASL